MNAEKARLQQLLTKLLAWLQRARRYSVPLFVAFVLLIYAIMLLRVQSLNNAQPTEDQVNSQVKAARIPHIDQSVVQQIQSLQDNSVNVQALFNQARNNPFQ